jgi:hypothetical protein
MATGVQINWASMSFASTVINRVTSANFGWGGQLIKFSGDTDIFPTVIANAMNDPHASITSGNQQTISGFSPGQTGTLVGTQVDAKQVSGGNVTYTLINAVFENSDFSGQHAQFGTATATWQAYSTDGSTPPLSIS